MADHDADHDHDGDDGTPHYDEGFIHWKRQRVDNWEQSPFLCSMKTKLVTATSRMGQATQTAFTCETMNAACAEWGWPNDEIHWKQVISVLQDFFNRKLGFKWRIRDVVDSNLLSDHHGYGDRHEDVKHCPSYCGVLTKTFDAAHKKGEKTGKQQINEMQKANKDVEKYRKETAVPYAARSVEWSQYDEDAPVKHKRNWWGGVKK